MDNNVNYDVNTNVGINVLGGFIGGLAAIGVVKLVRVVGKAIKEKREKGGDIEIHHER